MFLSASKKQKDKKNVSLLACYVWNIVKKLKRISDDT